MENLLKIVLSSFFRITAIFSPKLGAKLAWSFFCTPITGKKPLTRSETNLLKQAQQFFITSDEYKISVYQWKNSDGFDTAKTVLFTHGWGGHALNFSHIILLLINNGFNVVAYDSPAHGSSSGKQTNLLFNTKALLTVLQNIAPVYAYVGHSFGTLANAYAFEFLTQSEQPPVVEKMVLIAGPNELSDIFASFIRAMKLPSKVLSIFHQKLKMLAKRDIETMSAVHFLKEFTGSCLVIHDKNDRVVPYPEAQTIAHSIDAELFTTQAKGHFRILAANSVCEKINNFLHDNSL